MELAGFIAQPTSKTWVAVDSDEIVGFVVADQKNRKAAHIITIDVPEGRRRRGVGTLLMDAAEAWGKRLGCKFIYLETAEDNRSAQRFYYARGYKKISKIDRYYLNGTNAWVMGKPLT